MARGKMTEITILKLLSNRPMYGAEMIDEIKRLSGNCVIMSLPTLYSSLHRMATKKYVNSYQKESTIGGRCRVYNITKLGREYLAKNPIEIDYKQLVDNSTNAHKTFTSLEEAFSLPLNKKTSLPTELIEEKRVLQIQTPPALTLPTPTPAKAESKVSLYSPYIEPNEKITAPPEPQYQQTTIGLSGTTGGDNLRPLVNLNEITVGNNYVLINRLRFVSITLTTLIFMIINLIGTGTQLFCQECKILIYIILVLYFLIWLFIYLFYPRIKAAFNPKATGLQQIKFCLILIALVIICSISTAMPKLLWLLFVAMYPIVRFIFMTILYKRSWFTC